MDTQHGILHLEKCEIGSQASGIGCSGHRHDARGDSACSAALADHELLAQGQESCPVRKAVRVASPIESCAAIPLHSQTFRSKMLQCLRWHCFCLLCMLWLLTQRQADGDAIATTASGIPDTWTVRDIGPAAVEQLRQEYHMPDASQTCRRFCQKLPGCSSEGVVEQFGTEPLAATRPGHLQQLTRAGLLRSCGNCWTGRAVAKRNPRAHQHD